MRNARSSFRNGVIVVPAKFNVADIDWRGGIDYRALNGESESFKWWLSCWGTLRLVCTSDQLSPDDQVICRTIVEDWQLHNPVTDPVISRAWDPHAVAFRTEVYLDLAERLDSTDWIDPLIREQVDFLALPENFQGNWNHGVDQARALLFGANYLGDATLESLALERLVEAAEVIVASDGVSIEQAVHYHHYSYLQLERLLTVLETRGLMRGRLYDLQRRFELMPEFLAHATRPDGTWFEIGDTPWQEAALIDSPEVRYAATKGAEGTPPKRTVALYPESGYVFGRSGWGDAESFSRQSSYSFRFGPSRNLHGHHDQGSVAYYMQGRELLREGGFHGYTDDEQRAFLRSAKAHNKVAPIADGGRSPRLPAELVEHFISDEWQYFRIVERPYYKTTVIRSIVVSPKLDLLAVYDSASGPDRTGFEQRWFFHQDVMIRQDGADLVDERSSLLRLKQHLPTDADSILDSSDPNAPQLAGSTMHETTGVPAYFAQVRGKKATFLTSFAFGSDSRDAVFEFSSTGAAGSNRLELSNSRGSLRIGLAEDGRVNAVVAVQK